MFIYSNFFSPSANCLRYEEFLKDSYHGTVQNKFYDQENHNTKTVTIIRDEKPWNFIIVNDTLFFNFIEIGDSLVKTQNQDFIEIHRSNTTTNFIVNFDCETETQPK